MDDPVSIVIESDDPGPSIDPVTGDIATTTDDGHVVVQFGAYRKENEQQDDKFYNNLADDIGSSKLAQIAEELIEAISADDRSRQGHLTNRANGLELLGLEIKRPKSTAGDSDSDVEGISSVTNPLLLEALLKGWANSVGEFLPADGPVKIRDDGTASAAMTDIAEALERDLNHWFTTTAKEYYPDTSYMLLWGTYFGGSGFKKIYRCPMRRRPVSESVDEKDLIVSDTSKDLRSCARITHQIMMRPSVMKRMQFIGAYRDVALTQPNAVPNVVDARVASIQGVMPNMQRPEDQPYTIWECQCELDLPDYAPGQFKGEGIPLPYLVTLDKDSREILALRRDWHEDDEEQCERRRMYVRYPYVPGPGFYGTGLLSILGNSSAAMTAAWREALDAGMFASFPGGLISKLAGRQNTSNIRMSPGQFHPIETNGMPIAQAVMALPYKDVTAGLLTLIDKITEQSRQLGTAADIPAGEGIQNVPVGTMLAQIEQATKVMAAAHKGMHAAQAEEFELILELFRDHPEDFWRSNRICGKGFWDEQKFLTALSNCQLVPQADPNVPSHIHRLAKAAALVQLLGMPSIAPYMSPKEVLVRTLRILKEDEAGLVVDPQPNQQAADPRMMTAAARAQIDAKKLQLMASDLASKTQLQREKMAVQKSIADSNLQKELVIHQSDALKAARSDAHQRAMDLVGRHQQAAEADRAHQMDLMGHHHQVTAAERAHQIAMAKHALDLQQAQEPQEDS